MTTGSELVTSGIPQAGGLIRDSNGPYLQSYFAHGACEVTGIDSSADDPEQLADRIAACAEKADIVITTGGVSAGRFDLVPDAITRLGGDIVFHKALVRPGKPILFARLANGSLFFGLPGNPIAVAAGVRFFVEHAIAELQALTVEQPSVARCSEAMQVVEHMTFFGKGHAYIDEHGQLVARLLPGQESFRIHPLMQANCWIIVPEGIARVEKDEPVTISPLYRGALAV